MTIQKVLFDENEKIEAVYNILRLCGEDMFNNQGLEHWKTPYPVERISEDCSTKDVYLVLNDEKQPVATFQLSTEDDMLYLSKLGVSPSSSGQGVGGKCIAFMENECRTRGLRGICFDVYDKSTVAINFYLKHGFTEVGSHPTRRFRVLEMEKIVNGSNVCASGGGTFNPLFPRVRDREK